jgi:hypothetical protein
VPTISLEFAADTLSLDLDAGTLVTECRGPEGVAGEAAAELVAHALESAGHVPPLAAHVVPGDKVVLAIAGDVPQVEGVRKAVMSCLGAAGIAADDISVLRASPLDGPGMQTAEPGTEAFDPSVESSTAYLAADAEGRPLYMARQLVDADVVVAAGQFGWDASLAGRALEGELWPAFGRRENRESLTRVMLAQGRQALVDWRSELQDITWQLGVMASLRIVAGRGGSLHAACFGLPEEAARDARAAAANWRPRVEDPADVAITSLASAAPRFRDLVRAVAAAARVTQPDATVCVVGDLTEPPGLVMTRWRQGVQIEPLLREAAESTDPTIVADALATRLLARALGERRLVILSSLDQTAVEDLGFGHAAEMGVIERLANRAEHVVILHEGDRMLPLL